MQHLYLEAEGETKKENIDVNEFLFLPRLKYMDMLFPGEKRICIGMFCINSQLITNIQNMQGENCF